MEIAIKNDLTWFLWWYFNIAWSVIKILTFRVILKIFKVSFKSHPFRCMFVNIQIEIATENGLTWFLGRYFNITRIVTKILTLRVLLKIFKVSFKIPPISIYVCQYSNRNSNWKWFDVISLKIFQYHPNCH